MSPRGVRSAPHNDGVKIVRHISLNGTDRDFRELEALGVVLPDMGNVPKGSWSSTWPSWTNDGRPFGEWFLRRGERPGWEHTEFTKQEIAQADWLNMHSEWHHGYPQPEDAFGYNGLTYDIAAACPECSVG